jgi:5-methylcytosine-specific restriction endonuclease McrA
MTQMDRRYISTSALTDKGSTWAWRKTRKRILTRDRHTCQYCGALATTVDHKLPRRMGGGDEDSNLVACCTSCQHGGDRSDVRAGMHRQGSVFKKRGETDMRLSRISLPYSGSVVTRDYTKRGGGA